MTYYVKDGYQYSESFGNKIKTAVSAEDAASMIGKLPEFEEDAILNSSIADTSEMNGLKMVSFLVDGLDMQVSAFIDSSGNLTELVLESTSLILQSTSSAADEEAKTVTKMSNIEIGEFEIDFPADLDEYEEW